MNTRVVLDIASGPPSREAWKRLVSSLDAAPDVSRSFVRSLDEALAGWPDALRTLPRRWGTSARSDGRLRPLDPPHVAWRLGRVAHWRDAVDEDLAHALSAWPYVDRLKAITLHGSRPGDGLDALLRTPSLGRLTWLGLREVDLSTDPGHWLGAPSLASVRRLDFREARLSMDLLQGLARASWPQLERLHLGRMRFAPGPLAAALREVRWPSLRRLNLHGTPPTPALVNALVDNPSSRRLERLTIGVLEGESAALDPMALYALLRTKGLRNLKRLTLRGLRVDTDLRSLLSECDTSLDELVLRDCHVPERFEEQWSAVARGGGHGLRVRLR